jgi:hypothetical protein
VERTEAPEQSLRALLAHPQAPGELGRLGPYRVLGLLGAGGMGAVFEAEDPALGRRIALKVMLPSQADSARSRQRFLDEARAAAALLHDHVVPIYQVGEDRGVPFFAMPLLQGESLDARLRHGRLSADEVVRIGRQVAEGLAAAHERGLIHRDIKPSNIWLEAPGGRVKILDFGLARPAQRSEGLTQEGAILGTPGYMSPEQAHGQPVDHRTDLFSLGCVLYGMATGKAPFRGDDKLATLVAVASHQPPAPAALVPDLPPDLSDLIMALLSKAREQRPASARLVAEALTAVGQSADNVWATLPLPGEEVHAKPPSEVRKASPAGPRGWRGAAAGVALALVVALLGSILLYRVATDEGELVVRGKGAEGEVEVRRQGRRVARLSTLERGSIDLPTGEYEAVLVGDNSEVKLSSDRFVVRRGKQTSLTLSPVVQTIKDGLVVCPRGHGQYRTLAEAVARASEGMRLLLRRGTYQESVRITRRLVIEGETRDETRIDSATGPCLTLEADGIVLRNLTLRCRAGKDSEKPAVDITGGKNVIVEDCAFTTDATDHWTGGLVVRGTETDVTLRRCEALNCGGSGLAITRGARCRAVQCRFHDNGWWGAIVAVKAQGTFEECDVSLNPDAGLGVDGEESRLRAVGRCKIHGNGWGIGAYAGATLDVEDCTIEANNNNGFNVMEASKVTLTGSRIVRNRFVAVYAFTKAHVRVEKCDLRDNGRGAFLQETEARIEAKDNRE